MIRAVFFDLDGTLLPMDQPAFVDGYVKLLCRKLVPYGFDPSKVVEGLWKGVGAMAGNDGSMTNRDRFWQVFTETTGYDRSSAEPLCDSFYANEFNQACSLCGTNPLACEAIRLAGENGRTVALATNPVFPEVAQGVRLSWVGLKPEDFALVTHYSSDSFSKPSSGYYLSICDRLGLKPEEVLMVGNDEREDMYGASAVGMRCFLVTDSMIPSDRFPWCGDRGTFAELLDYLKGL